MGRLEKIVVLAVLLLVAVVLGVALNTEDPAYQVSGPLGSKEEALSRSAVARNSGFEAPPLGFPARGAPAPEAPGKEVLGRSEPSLDPVGARPGRAARQTPGGLLEATLAPSSVPLANGSATPASFEQATRNPDPDSDPKAGSGLVTLAGLTPTALDDLMQYTWRAGDGFADLAERFYGSRDRAARLYAANEGLRDTDIRAGAKVWIPTGFGEEATKSAAASWKAGQLYVVRSGDILGKISQTVYGTSREWKKIYNANRDILSNPNSLREGMKLRIPE